MIASALLACALSASEATYLQRVLDGWSVITRDFLKQPDEPLPWMVLYSRSCAFHLAADPARPPGRQSVSLSTPRLTYLGRAVPLRAEPITDAVPLPDGSRLPIAGLAFTSVYGEEGSAKPYFATALPDVWAHDPKYADDPTEWSSFLLDVLAHELVHTRQIVTIRSRLEELHTRHPSLPSEVNDDWLQKTVGTRPGLDATVRAEIALLYQAAAEPDATRAAELTRVALALMRARRTTYFADAAAAYSPMEDLFLNMEGVACWAAFQLARTRAPGTTLDAFRGNRKWWSQEEGLALFLLLDRFVPDWRKRVFPPEMASPVDLLRSALEAQ